MDQLTASRASSACAVRTSRTRSPSARAIAFPPGPRGVLIDQCGSHPRMAGPRHQLPKARAGGGGERPADVGQVMENAGQEARLSRKPGSREAGSCTGGAERFGVSGSRSPCSSSAVVSVIRISIGKPVVSFRSGWLQVPGVPCSAAAVRLPSRNRIAGTATAETTELAWSRRPWPGTRRKPG